MFCVIKFPTAPESIMAVRTENRPEHYNASGSVNAELGGD